MRVLCLAPHPDDLEVYMGATLLLLVRGGAAVRALVLTDGERGTRQPIETTRLAEQQASFGALGIEGRYLHLPDQGLATVADLEAHVRREVDGYRARLVFAPHPGDPHSDHASLARAAPATAWRWLPFWPPAPPSHHVVMAEGFGPKAELIRRHASQIPGPAESRAHLPDGFDILERARERDRACGRALGLAFAEPLIGPEGTKAPALLEELDDFIGGEA